MHACADFIESVTQIPADKRQRQQNTEHVLGKTLSLCTWNIRGVVAEEKLRLLAVWDSGSYLDK